MAMSTVECTENKSSSHALVLDYYGMREEPFGVTPNPRFLYFSPSHREALASLIYAIEAKRGFTALVAEPGSGKTTLIFHLLDKMKSSARTVFLFRPDNNARELLQSMLGDLGLNATGQDIPQMHDMLNTVLLQELQAGRHFLWVIDEAQDLEVDVLEVVRLLSNFETTSSKLMHIILSGQPALLEKLERPELLQLRQRVSAVVRLGRLSSAEASDYIEHRLRLSGCKRPDLFPPETRNLIAKVSRGIPRNINNLCFLCLSLGFAEQAPVMTPQILEAVLADHEAANKIPKPAFTRPPAVSELPKFQDISSNSIPGSAPHHATSWLDQELGLVEPPPQRSKFWTVFAVFGFLVVPLALFLIASDSNINFLDGSNSPALDSLVQQVTGYDAHLPEAPQATAPALRPPRLPDNLAQLTQPPTDPEALQQDSANTTETASPAKLHSASSRPVPTSLPAPKPTGPRVVYARRDETIFQLAMESYGRSNWTIVGKIRSQNPNIRDAFAVIHRGQRVVLPDLTPEYPWKVAAGTPPSSKSFSKYSRRF
jgi:type II secretory pathway predicted ATPase ExeA/phage tail protein X